MEMTLKLGIVLAAAVLTFPASPVAAPAQSQPERVRIRVTQFLPANDTLSRSQQEAIATAARSLMRARQPGCAAPCLRLDPGYRVMVVGHAFIAAEEQMGPAGLSQFRANRVRQLLLDAGLPEGRVWTVACGDAVPSTGPNNERVEIFLERENAQPRCD